MGRRDAVETAIDLSKGDELARWDELVRGAITPWAEYDEGAIDGYPVSDGTGWRNGRGYADEEAEQETPEAATAQRAAFSRATDVR